MHGYVPSVQIVGVGSHEMVQFFHLTVDSNVAEVEERVQAAIFQLQKFKNIMRATNHSQVQHSKVLGVG